MDKTITASSGGKSLWQLALIGWGSVSSSSFRKNGMAWAIMAVQATEEWQRHGNTAVIAKKSAEEVSEYSPCWAESVPPSCSEISEVQVSDSK